MNLLMNLVYNLVCWRRWFVAVRCSLESSCKKICVCSVQSRRYLKGRRWVHCNISDLMKVLSTFIGSAICIASQHIPRCLKTVSQVKNDVFQSHGLTICTAVVVWCPRLLGHFSMECLLSVTGTATTRMTEGSHSTITLYEDHSKFIFFF